VIWEIGSLNLNTTFAGTIRNGNQAGGSNTTSLTKVGTGTLTLSGASTYTGTTTISNGILETTLATSLPIPTTVVIATPGKLNLNFVGTNFVKGLVIDGVTQANGTYGATGSGAANIDNTHFIGTGVLWVGTPPAMPLSHSISGDQLVLEWPANPPWRLQVQTNELNTGISTNWVDVPTPSNPYFTPIDQLNPTIFYRLVYP